MRTSSQYREDDTQILDAEGLWNAVFGYGTPESVIADAEAAGFTPQDYTADCIRIAIEQGLTGDKYEHFAALCRELKIPAM